MVERETLKVNEQGRLEIGGCDCVDLAKQYSTPLYVLDEAYIRSVCRGYTAVLNTYGDALICYASKAFSTKAIYEICASENLGADVVSAGELYTALSANMPADKMIFHGNNKSPFELELAVKNGVHAVVIDSEYEVELLNEIARENGVVQNVMVRVNPGIDAHTHKFIQTTRVDSKFGFSIADGTALEIIKIITQKTNLHFVGPHCHIGSQIFSLEPFRLAVDKMTDFIVALNKEGVEVEELNLGGGYGVRYTDADAPLKPVEYVSAIIERLKECIAQKGIKKPRLILEPGRSIVAEAGITLYSVGAIKEIKGIKKYVSVDGGMFEAPRYALYGAEYDCILANRANEKPVETVTISGKCCESGDMVACDVKIPVAKSGDIVAVLSTGAYHYSMASNYNRNLVPPVVLVNEGKSDYIVKPQTYDDIMSRDQLPIWLKK